MARPARICTTWLVSRHPAENFKYNMVCVAALRRHPPAWHGLSGRAMPAGKCDCNPMPASTAWRAVPCGRAGCRPAAGRMLPKLVDIIRAVHMLCRAVLAG